MKKNVLLLAITLISMFSFGQVKDPVKWNFESKKIDATIYELHLTATIDQGWHLYSQATPDGGPIPTTISFTKNPLLVINGKAKEVGKLEQKHEPLFGVDVKQFSNKVVFVQTVKLKGKAKTTVIGNLEFMACNDRECLPPITKKFSIALN